MSDIGVDYLFKDIIAKRIKAKYSRLYCDVEKFKDETKEFMSKYGQGVIYTHTYDGMLFHQHDDKYKKKVYKYYDRYHKRLDRVSKRLLSKNDKLLILDIHSYSDELASKHHEGPFPNICIGIKKDYYDEVI
jgi:N-formylglutamate amidohydrolase